MPTYLLDTNAVSDLMAENPKVLAKVSAQSDNVLSSAIVRGEILYGVQHLPRGKRRTTLEAKADQILASLICEPVTENVADTYARLRVELEDAGLSLDDNDLWIAATSLAIGAILISRDTDFAKVSGLQAENWTK